MISPNELSERLLTGDPPVVLDVRSAAEFQGPLGRLEGAVNIPVDELSNHL
jgi:rhodanese-related sulfurtransferase